MFLFLEHECLWPFWNVLLAPWSALLKCSSLSAGFVLLSQSPIYPFQLSKESKPCQRHISPRNRLEPLFLEFYPFHTLLFSQRKCIIWCVQMGEYLAPSTACTECQSFCKLVSHPACIFPSKPWDLLEVWAAALSMETQLFGHLERGGKTNILGRQRSSVPIGWMRAAPPGFVWLVIFSLSGEEERID